MGLGPPVCDKCMVGMRVPPNWLGWKCPICKTTETGLSEFMLTSAQREEIRTNEQFYKFLKIL